MRPFVRTLALAGAIAFASATVAAVNGSGASSTTVVAATVPTATQLTNLCTQDPARKLGVVQPGSTTTSTTGASVCRLDFGSSNGTAQLRMSQADGIGTAMATSPDTWSDQQGIDYSYIGDFDLGATAGVVYTVSNASWVLRSADGGQSWTNLGQSGLGPMFSVVNDTTLWSANGSTLGRSTTSGASFSNESAALAFGAESITSVSAAPGTTVTWVGGDAGTIKRQTAVAGAWGAQASSLTEVVDLEAIDASNAWALGRQGASMSEVRRWNGATWTVQTDPPLIGTPEDLAATTGACAWVIAPGEIMRTADGGNTWQSGTVPTDNGGGTSFLSVTASGCGAGATVWLTGRRGDLWVSTDGGATFARRYSTLTQVDGVSIVGGGVVLVGGPGIGVSRSGDSGATWATTRTGFPTLEGVAAASSTRAWAVGSHGLVRTTSDGTTWGTSSNGTFDALYDVAWVSGTTAVAVGNRGTIARTTDGSSWAQVATGLTTSQLLSVAFSGDAGWAVGRGGTVARSIDGGATWTTQSAAPLAGTVVTGVSAASDQVGWAVTANGVVARTTNGGTSWAATATPSVGAYFTAVSAISDQVAFVGSPTWPGTTWRTTDGGATWTTFGTGASVDSIDTVSPEVVVVVGIGDFIRRTTDSGATWTDQVDGFYSDYTDVDMLDAGSGWAVGTGGATIKAVQSNAVPDLASAADWGSGTGGLFGVCVQDVALAATVTAPWVEDVTTTPGTCQATTTDPWRGLPTAPSTVATANALGGSGRVDLVWGFRAGTSQAPGAYVATVRFDVIAT